MQPRFNTRIAQSHGTLLSALRDKLLPHWQGPGPKRVVKLPDVKAAGFESTPLAVPLLEDKGEKSPDEVVAYLDAHYWPDASVHAMRHPYLGWLVEGCADLRFGITKSMASENKSLGKAGVRVLSLPESAFFIVPPGVPFDNGELPHYFGKNFKAAHSEIFWLHAVPAGALCHTCQTRGQSHVFNTDLFVLDGQINTLVELLMDELREHPGGSAVAQNYIHAILLRLERGLANPPHRSGDAVNALAGYAAPPRDADTSRAALARAREYIRGHYDQPLSPTIVARHSYISASHLMRLFREEHDSSVMKYLTQCRVEAAKLLLHNTELPIHEIARLVGYKRLSHFSKAFSASTQHPPRAYREASRRLLQKDSEG